MRVYTCCSSHLIFNFSPTIKQYSIQRWVPQEEALVEISALNSMSLGNVGHQSPPVQTGILMIIGLLRCAEDEVNE